MAAFTYTKPTVGGSEDAWGNTLNANWDALGAFIGPLDSAELAVLDGITASTAELNLLDGVTATTAEINHLDGVTSGIQSQINGVQSQIDSIPASVQLSQVQVEDDTSTVFGQVSGQRLAQAVAVAVDYGAGNAALAAGAIGTYTFAKFGSDTAFGATVSGASLLPTSAAYGIVQTGSIALSNFFNTGSALTGTWRCMATFDAFRQYSFEGGFIYGATLWMRIA